MSYLSWKFQSGSLQPQRCRSFVAQRLRRCAAEPTDTDSIPAVVAIFLKELELELWEYSHRLLYHYMPA